MSKFTQKNDFYLKPRTAAGLLDFFRDVKKAAEDKHGVVPNKQDLNNIRILESQLKKICRNRKNDFRGS